MKYYIMYPDSMPGDWVYDSNQLGDKSFKTFWAAGGFKILADAVNNGHMAVEHFKIIKENGQHLTVEEFLDEISTLKVRLPD